MDSLKKLQMIYYICIPGFKWLDGSIGSLKENIPPLHLDSRIVLVSYNLVYLCGHPLE